MKETPVQFTTPTSPLKDPRGVWRTKTLFKELNDLTEFGNGDPVVPIFTLNEFDDPLTGCVSFKRLYVEIGDPTEYKQAKYMLGSVDHWEYLKKSDWMQDLLASCKKELALKLESEAFEAIKNEGLTADKAAVRIQAFKTVLSEAQNRNEEHVAAKRKGAGRPSKAEVEAQLKQATKEQKKIYEDYQRIQVEQGKEKGKEEQGPTIN